jgi:hypothetical protein
VIAQLDDSMIESLSQHLPAGQRTRADLITSLRSPQMQQTVIVRSFRPLSRQLVPDHAYIRMIHVVCVVMIGTTNGTNAKQ